MVNRVGKPINHNNLVNRCFHPALKDAEIDRIPWHDLRHTKASLMIEQKENLKYIQTQLGHSSPTVTLNVYAHLLKPINQEAACRYENMVFENSGSRNEKRGHGVNGNPLTLLVGAIGFEPTTSSVSGKRSPPELRA